MSEPLTYLRVQVTSRSRKSDSLYFNEIEDSIHRMTKRFAGVTAMVSDASDTLEGEFSESFCIGLTAVAPEEEITAAIIGEIRRIGIKRGYSFTLSKRTPRQNRSDDVREMKVLPSRGSKWVRASGKSAKRTRPVRSERFPERISYLQATADRYYGEGGNDVFSVFRGDLDLNDYFIALSKRQLSELREVYSSTVSVYSAR